MDNRKKRKLTFLTIGLIFLLSGVEYGELYFGGSLFCSPFFPDVTSVKINPNLFVKDTYTVIGTAIVSAVFRPNFLLSHLGILNQQRHGGNWKSNFSFVISMNFQ